MLSRSETERKCLLEARSFAEDYVESTSPRELLRHMEIFQLVFIVFLGLTLLSLFYSVAEGFEIGGIIASLTQLLCIILALRYSSHMKSGRNILVFLLVLTLMSAVLLFIGEGAREKLDRYYVYNPYLYSTFYGFAIFFFKLLVERQVEYELYQELLKKSGTNGRKGGLEGIKDKIVAFIDWLLVP